MSWALPCRFVTKANVTRRNSGQVHLDSGKSKTFIQQLLQKSRDDCQKALKGHSAGFYAPFLKRALFAVIRVTLE